MIKSLKFVVLIGAIIFLIVGCANTNVKPAEQTKPNIELKISGSGTVNPLLSGIKEEFEADYPNYTLTMLSGVGTGGGVKGVLQKTLDVATMARAPKDSEPIEYVEIGKVGTAVIAHVGVTGVTNLSKEQVVGVFSGDITNWSALGGNDHPIILYVRDEGDSTTQNLRKYALGDVEISKNVTKVLSSQGEMLKIVEDTPYSIGIANWPTAVALKTNIQYLKIENITPDDPTYPMLKGVGIGYLSERHEDIQPLATWLTSEKGKTAFKSFGMIVD